MIIQGDCLDVMKTYPDNHFTGIVTDPPYGISFLGKDWDHSIPGVPYWQEALRICKPGAHLLAFAGTRTFHRLACALEDAGWEIRDCINWMYGSGFPKSHNFGKKIGDEWQGYGTALKPAWEPILVCMKPCDGTFANNAETHGLAGINIDACRIGVEGGTKRSGQADYPKTEQGTVDRSIHWARTGHSINQLDKGRWPANVILDEEAGEMLDGQSGELKSRIFYSQGTNSTTFNGCLGRNPKLRTDTKGYTDSGGASRFFYCAKPSPSERDEGMGESPIFESQTLYGCTSPGRNVPKHGGKRKNNHPTVKPIKLMQYLLKLIAPPKNALILDPFAGSGSTLVAACKLGIDCVGIELSAEYCEIARARLENCKDLFTKAM
jgi:DNA modification methylase